MGIQLVDAVLGAHNALGNTSTAEAGIVDTGCASGEVQRCGLDSVGMESRRRAACSGILVGMDLRQTQLHMAREKAGYLA